MDPITELTQRVATLEGRMGSHTHQKFDGTQPYDTIFGIIYVGDVSATPAAGTIFPTGWTVGSDAGTGGFNITHNLNTTSYVVVANGTSNADTLCMVTTRNANNFVLVTTRADGGAAVKKDFSFILVIRKTAI